MQLLVTLAGLSPQWPAAQTRLARGCSSPRPLARLLVLPLAEGQDQWTEAGQVQGSPCLPRSLPGFILALDPYLMCLRRHCHHLPS